MANTKITELSPATSADSADLIEMVDVSDTAFGASGTNKKITKDVFLGTVLTGTTASFTTAKDTKLTGLQKSVVRINPAENSGLYLRLIPSKITAGASGTQAGGANRIIISPFVSPETTIAKNFSLNVTALSAATNQYSICVYSDLNGVPDTLLFESDNISASSTGNKDTVNGYTFLAGVQYWLGVRSEQSGTLTTLHTGSCVDLPSTAPSSNLSSVNKTIIKNLTGVFATPLSTTLPTWSYSSSEYNTLAPYAISVKF